MTRPNWIRRLTAKLDAQSSAARRPSRRLRLEDLEDRAVPAGVGTELVSLSAAGQLGDGDADTEIALSTGGRYVAFASQAANLVDLDGDGAFDDDTSNSWDIFVRDRQDGTIRLVSTSSPSTSLPAGAKGNGDSRQPTISNDGRYVAFHSTATNLVSAGIPAGQQNIYRKDLQTGDIVLLSQPNGGGAADGNSQAPKISAGGEFVGFSSTATNLAGSDANASFSDVFLWQAGAGLTRITSGTGGAPHAFVSDVSQSGDVVFFSQASDFRAGRGTLYLCQKAGGAIFPIDVLANGLAADNGAAHARISDNGNYVYFDSMATNLVIPDANGSAYDVFRWDRYGEAPHLSMVSRSATGQQGIATSADPFISADGRYVAFVSYASNLVAGDSNGFADVFVKDTQTGDIVRVNVGPSGEQANAEHGGRVGISPDGTVVGFPSAATNLVAGDTNGRQDAFVNQIIWAPTVVSTTPTLSGGTVFAGTTTLQVTFSEAIVGGGTAANFELRRAGADGLLGTADDVAVPLTAAFSGATTTLTFPALPEDVYRLTIHNEVVDTSSHALDGNQDGVEGGDWVRDFVVGANTYSLTAPGGSAFDVAFGGSGAGQLVQGTGNAFDGLGRLQVGGTDYLTVLQTITASVGEGVPTAALQNVSSTWAAVPGMQATVTTDGTSPVRLSATLLQENNSGSLIESQARFVVDGNPIVPVRALHVHMPNSGWVNLDFEDYVPLAAGTHTVTVEVMAFHGTLSHGSHPGYSTLRAVAVNVPAGSSGALSVGEGVPTAALQNVSSTWAAVPGMQATVTTDGTSPVRLSATLLQENNSGSLIESQARFVVDGNPIVPVRALHVHMPNSGWVNLDFEDYVPLAAGTHTVTVEVMAFRGTLSHGSHPGYSTLRAVAVNVPAGSSGALSVGEGVPTAALQNVSSTWAAVPGMQATVSTDGTSPVRLSATLLQENNSGSLIESQARFVVDGNPIVPVRALHVHMPNSGWVNLDFEDYVPLAAGTHTVTVEVMAFHGTLSHGSHPGYSTLRAVAQTAVSTPQLIDGSRTVLTPTQTLAGLTVSREITVPNSGGQDFARTVDVFANPTDSPITTNVTIVGNLGSDLATTVFATSDGDSIVETSDQWIGTDDADATGTPSLVHLIHGPSGLRPDSVQVIGDNVEWMYTITVQPGQTVRLAQFTVLANTRAAAVAAANALVTPSGFGGQAAGFLTQAELDSLANFAFNQAPIVVDDSYSTNEDTQLIVSGAGVLVNDTDANGNTLTAVLVRGPSQGGLILDPSGSFTYTPRTNYHGPDSFTYRAHDGTIAGNVATVNLTVTEVNDPPRLKAGTLADFAVAEDSGLTSLGLGGLVYTSGEPPALPSDPNGDADGDTIPNGSDNAPNNPDGNQLDSDGDGVGDVADPAPLDPAIGAETQVLAFAVTTVPVPEFGTVFLADGTSTVVAGQAYSLGQIRGMQFRPAANGHGVGTFAFAVTDDGTTAGSPDPQTLNQSLTITVSPVNDAPTLAGVPGITSVPEGDPYSFTATAADVDSPTANLRFSLDGAPAGAAIDPVTGVFTWTPSEGQGAGSFPFTVRVTDGVATTTQAVTVTVLEINQAPTLAAIGDRTVDEASTLQFTASATDHDLPANGLTYSLVGAPADATIDPASGAFSWTRADGPRIHGFIVRATDNGSPALSHTMAFIVQVRNVAPTATFANDGTVNEGTSATFRFTNVADPSAPDAAAGFRYDTAENVAGLATEYDAPATSPQAVHNWTFGDSGTYTIYGRVFDQDGGYTTYQSTVTLANVAPSATLSNDGPVAEGSAVTVQFTGATDPAVVDRERGFHYAFATDAGTLPTTYATAGLSAAQVFTFPDDGTYTVWGRVFDKDDGFRDYATQVTVSNVAPTATADVATTPEEQSVILPVRANDTDPAGANDPLTVAAVTQPAHGTAVVNADGTVTYTPARDYNGPDSFTYTIDDGDGGTATGTVSLTVTPVNDAPVAFDDAVVTPEDTARTIAPGALTGNDTDVDNTHGQLTITAVSSPSNGSVVLNPGGTITFTPTPDFFGTAGFRYTLSDGALNNVPIGDRAGLVTVAVTSVNDAPVANADVATMGEDGAVTLDPRANDAAGPANESVQTLLVTAATQGAHGTVTFTAAGVTYTPSADYYGQDTFTYTVTDNGTINGAADPRSTTATVTVTVTPVNDAPVAVDDAVVTAEDRALTLSPAALTGNDTDLDNTNADLSITAVSSPINGTVVLNPDGTVTFTPTPNFFGIAGFRYTLSDGALNNVPSGDRAGLVTVAVTPVNDAPAFQAGADLTVQEDSGVFTAPWAIPLGAGPANESGQTLNFIVNNITNPELFAVRPAISPTGGLTFSPAPNASGSAAITVLLQDNGGRTNGGLDLSASQWFTITVDPVNDAPVALDDAVVTPEDTALTLSPAVLKGNDTDIDNANGQLTITAVSSPSNGTVVLNPDGTITFTPTPNFFGTAGFRYTLSDGALNNVPTGDRAGLVTVAVTPVNDVPVVQDLGGPATGVRAEALAYTGSAVDVDGPSLTYAWDVFRDGATTSSAAGSGPGFTFTPVDAGSYDVILTVTDGIGGLAVVSTATEVKVVDLRVDPADDTRSVLLVGGTAGADAFAFDRVNGQVRVSLDGTAVATYVGAGSVRVLGGGGADVFTVNASSGAGLILDGQDGADVYTINFGDLGGSVTVADSGAAGPTDTLLVNGTAADDAIGIKNGVVTRTDSVDRPVTYAGVESTTVSGGAGNDSLTDPDSSDLVLLGGAGDDTIVIQDTTGTGVTADGGEGSDTYVVNTDNLQAPVSLADSGTSGTDSLSVNGTPGTDTITQTDTQVVVNGGTINLGGGMDALTVDGGGGAGDQFTVVGTPAVTATVQGVADAVVRGTEGDDTIVLTPGNQPGQVVARVNNVVVGTYTSADRILVYGLGGNDNLQVAGSISTPMWLYGGDGADRLKGGPGHDVLIGGEGVDLLVGGQGRDLLVGGFGADRLVGNADEDILVAGTTAYDTNAVALSAIMAEWTGAASYTDRVANLTTGVGEAGDVRLVGDDGAAPTVFTDTDVDTLTGSQAQDWFFANQANSGGGAVDVVTDLAGNETYIDTDF